MNGIAKFPFKKITETKYGIIFRPYAVVEFFSITRKKWIPVEMVVDSGADYTILPQQYASILNIDLNKDCEKNITSGIGGKEAVYFLNSIPVKLNSWENKIPIGFLKRNDIPPLMGRLGFIEELNVTFFNRCTYFLQPSEVSCDK